jgi:serine/threonine-protein kinase RsbW
MDDGKMSPSWRIDMVVTPPDTNWLLVKSVDAGSVDELRRLAGALAERCGLTDIALMKFVLVVHELTANAVRHGGGRADVRIGVSRDDLWCHVVDHGRGVTSRVVDGVRRPAGRQVAGWGLWLVRQICPDLHVETGGNGTSVALRFPVRDATPGLVSCQGRTGT